MVIQFKSNKKEFVEPTVEVEEFDVVDTTRATTFVAIISCSLVGGFALAVLFFLLIL